MVSVIVPVFNVEKYLSRCVDSILSQSYQNIEILIADDGSPDTSAEYCDEYAFLNNNIISIHKLNSGVSDTRNKGVVLSRSEYVSFIDSDDWINERFYEILMREIINNDTEIAICEAEQTSGENNNQSISSNVISVKRTRNEAIEYYASLSTTSYRAPWGKVIKKEFVVDNPFPVNRSYAEDAACVYRWIWDAKNVSCIDNKLYYYFENPYSVCHSEVKLNIVGGLETDEEWISFYKENGFHSLYELSLKQYMDDCVWMYYGLRLSSKPENAKVISRKLRQFVWKYRKEVSLSFDENYDICAVLSPSMVRAIELAKWIMSTLKQLFMKAN